MRQSTLLRLVAIALFSGSMSASAAQVPTRSAANAERPQSRDAAIDARADVREPTEAEQDHVDTLFGKLPALIASGDPYGFERAAAEILQISKATYGPNHPATAGALNSLASGFHALKQLDRATSDWREAYRIRINRLGADSEITLGTGLNLVASLCDQYQFPEAEVEWNTLKGSLANQRAAFQQQASVIRSQCLLFNGENTKAIGEVQKAVELAARDGRVSNATRQAIVLLAAAFSQRDENAVAIELFRSLTDHPSDEETPTDKAHLWGDLGVALSESGSYQEAANAFNKARDFAAADDQNLQADLDKYIGTNFYRQHNYTEALKNHRSALGRIQNVGDNMDIARIAAEIASDFTGLGNFDSALKYDDEAVKTATQSLGPNHPDTVRLAENRAIGLVTARRYSEAERALRTICVQRDGFRTAALVQLEAPISLQSADAAETNCSAHQLWSAANTLAQMTPSDPGRDPVFESGFAAAQRLSATKASSAISAASARELAVRSGVEKDAERYDQALRATQTIDANFSAVAEQIRPVSADTMSKLVSARAEATRRAETAQKAIRSAAPAYWDYLTPPIVTAAELAGKSPDASDARLLSTSEALVLWTWLPGAQHGFVFAVSKSGPAWAEMTLSGAQIADRVSRLRRQIDPCGYGQKDGDCGARGRPFDRATAYELYQALLGQPQIQAVVGPQAIKTLLIVPSGPLTALPPALLVTAPPPGDEHGEDNVDLLRETPWLIRTKALAVLPSVSALRTLRVIMPQIHPAEAPAAAASLFMMADPDFSGLGEPANATDACPAVHRSVEGPIKAYYRDASALRQALAKLPRLRCTQREAKDLKAMFGGAEVLTGGDAREARLRSPQDQARLARADVVAFATHGLVSGDFGLGEPALVLAAPRPGETDDGLLTASEAAILHLNADWVLLSACNTASPDAEDAYGLSGLARAFFYAGARSLLVSHWRVDDDATEALIHRTMALRRQHLPKAQALQQATLELLDGKIGPQLNSTANPAAWAPFTLIGEPR
jgi:CHAT domain-containing protein